MRTYKVNGEISEKAYNLLGKIMDGLDEVEWVTIGELQDMAREVCMTVVDEPDNVARNNEGLGNNE